MYPIGPRSWIYKNARLKMSLVSHCLAVIRLNWWYIFIVKIGINNNPHWLIPKTVPFVRTSWPPKHNMDRDRCFTGSWDEIIQVRAINWYVNLEVKKQKNIAIGSYCKIALNSLDKHNEMSSIRVNNYLSSERRCKKCVWVEFRVVQSISRTLEERY